MIDALQNVYDYARANFIPIMDKECEDVLVDLIKKNQPKRILEIGTAVGYSASIMLLNCEQSEIDTIDIDAERIEIAKKLWSNIGIESRINSYVGDVDKILRDVIKDKTYDFVFLDGPKSRYLKHLNEVTPNLNIGGVVLVDDVLFFGLVKGNEFVPHKHRTIVTNLRIFLKFLEESKQFNTELLEKGNGIAIMRKL